MTDQAQTPLSDLVTHALERMEAGARMILEDIPADSNLSSSCHSSDVTREIARLCRIGASVMPRPIEEAGVNEHILRFKNDAFQGCDYWYDLWKQNYQQWPEPPTHFIPLSALPKPQVKL